MKMIIVALALVAVAVAAPPSVPDAEAKVVRSEFNQAPEGGYVFSFETDHGIQRLENGEVKDALDEENKPHPVVVVRGTYTYIDADGKLETITYYADETGYHAEGDSIPKVLAGR